MKMKSGPNEGGKAAAPSESYQKGNKGCGNEFHKTKRQTVDT
jgi:hypothetical protein